ncbi:MAG TPA: hypothetical protein VL361_10690 [Candidatus Limnocylindrales bacterium]|nr:hypothetical protein [Candidatus Limnocylindrales bacterium]
MELGLITFPALQNRPASGQTAERVLEEGESTCFYHSDKRAVVPCDQCGRFLCALCDIELEGKHLCPACLETGRDKRKLKVVEHKRTRYDQIVWSLLILPLPFCAISAPVTASTALVIALRRWGAPPSLVANTKLRLILGMLVGCVELGFSIWFWNRAVFSSWHVAK